MQKRRRFKQADTLGERLARQAALLRERADALPEGDDKALLLHKIQQVDFAIDLDEKLRSPLVGGE
jgi:hypothetical protein